MSWLDRALLRPARSTHADAVGGGTQGVVVYWRPGCVFCQRLRMRTWTRRERATWVDIWSDDDARAFVRSVNDGNETVPTVVIDGEAHTNPDPRLVVAALDR